MSFFDSVAFNDRLFFPRDDKSACAGADDVFVDVDSAVLHLRMHRPNPSATRTLLLFHGNGEVVADYDVAAAAYANAGAALAVVDYRGYGASTGVPTLRDMIDDVAAVVGACAARSALPLVVMGRSLGSLCAAEVCGRPEFQAVSSIVIESGIARLDGLVERRGLPVPDAFDPEDVAAFDPLAKLRRGKRPLLVIHGEEDELIDVSEGQTLHDVAGAAHKTMIRVPGRGHNDLSFSPLYWAALRKFLP